MDIKHLVSGVVLLHVDGDDLSGIVLCGRNLGCADARRVVCAGTDFSRKGLKGASYQIVGAVAALVAVGLAAASFLLFGLSAMGGFGMAAPFALLGMLGRAGATNLKGADLSEAHCAGADFRGADLRQACFRGADLRNARFEDAQLVGADFSGATVKGARFSCGQLLQAGFAGALYGSTTVFGMPGLVHIPRQKAVIASMTLARDD